MEYDYVFSPTEQGLLSLAEGKRLPFSGGFELIPYCNLSCKMCYVKDLRPGLQILSGEQWLEIGRQAVEMGVFGVVLTGGEPMIHPDFKMIYTGLRNMGLILQINTNGTMIDEPMADFLAENMPRRVNISLYGADRDCYGALCGVPDAFDKTIRAIELLQERNVPVKINVTPNTINFPQMPQILALCRKYGLHKEVTPYLFEPVRRSETERQQYRVSPGQMAAIRGLLASEDVDRDEWMKKKVICYELWEHFRSSKPEAGLQHITCRAGVSGFWICWDGTMNLCVMMPEPKADVLREGFAAAWERVKAYSDTIRVPVRCNTCALRHFCNPCAAVSLHETGDCTKISPYLCQTAQEYARMMANGIVKKERSEAESERNI